MIQNYAIVVCTLSTVLILLYAGLIFWVKRGSKVHLVSNIALVMLIANIMAIIQAVTLKGYK